MNQKLERCKSLNIMHLQHFHRSGSTHYLPELSGKPRRSGRGWIARMDSSDGEAVHLF
jgi:hypothetical protein